jgi:hypothetical protein
MQYKRGMRPFVEDERDIQYRTVSHLMKSLFVKLPVRPEQWGQEALVPKWAMFANDSVGDCVIAAILHMIVLWNAMRGVVVEFTDEIAIGCYTKITGYDPNATPDKDGNNPTDQGTDIRDALTYFQKYGVVDTAGRLHKIGPFMRVNPSNYENIQEAAFIYGGLIGGFALTASADSDFMRGTPWDYTEDEVVDGYHCVPYVAHRFLDIVITWGETQKITPAFFKGCNVLFLVLDPEMLKEGMSLSGLTLEQLQSCMKGLC